MLPRSVDDFGILIDGLTIESVKKAIEQCELISHDELIINSIKAMKKAYKDYTLENYQTTMRKNLQNILTKVNNG